MGTISRRKIRAGFTSRMVNRGHRVKSSVDNRPKANPFTRGISEMLNPPSVNPSWSKRSDAIKAAIIHGSACWSKTPTTRPIRLPASPSIMA